MKNMGVYTITHRGVKAGGGHGRPTFQPLVGRNKKIVQLASSFTHTVPSTYATLVQRLHMNSFMLSGCVATHMCNCSFTGCKKCYATYFKRNLNYMYVLFIMNIIILSQGHIYARRKYKIYKP